MNIKAAVVLPNPIRDTVNYPCLASSGPDGSGMLVLFTSPNTGTLLTKHNSRDVGHFSNEWLGVEDHWHVLPKGTLVTLLLE